MIIWTTDVETAIEFRKFKEKIERFEYNMPKIAKKMMVAAFTPMRADAVALARRLYTRRTGRLFKAINYWAFNDMAGALTTKKNERKNSAFYASFLEKGLAKKNIKARPFMKPSFDRYFGGDAKKGMALMDKRLQTEMERIIEKNQGK
ncbi:MAG: hypothetical protein LBK43_03605 [Treponema sp.]|jgi:hypothetical protein|nr:hypothetical protein [Treponema sp.]